jgi:hypothetical protein
VHRVVFSDFLWKEALASSCKESNVSIAIYGKPVELNSSQVSKHWGDMPHKV